MFVIYLNNIKHSAWSSFFDAETQISSLRNNGCSNIEIRNEDTELMLDGEYFV